MPRIYASVYGCPTNIADCELSLGILKEAGFEIVSSPEESDLNIIFTCIVKTPTEQRMIRKIQELSGSGKPLVVSGCMAKTSQRTIERMCPNASILGPNSISHVAEVTRAALEGKKVIFVRDDDEKKSGERVRSKKLLGIVPISSGCLSNCAYCAVKFARGKLRSYPADAIVEDARRLVGSGCREIWLTSQDNGCYGVDTGSSLPELVEKVCSVDGKFKIRIGMMNPTYLKGKTMEKLVDAYKNEKVSKFIHIPVQSGSDKVLKDMKRGYSVADFENIVERFRKEIPEIFISTDVIVGFPGETDEDFQMTVDLLKKTKPDKVNISKFGSRPGTEASKMEQLPTKVVNERSRILHKMMEKK